MKDPLREHLEKLLKDKTVVSKSKNKKETLTIEEVYDLILDYFKEQYEAYEESNVSLKNATSKGSGLGLVTTIDSNLILSIIEVIDETIDEVISDYDVDENVSDYDQGRISAFTSCKLMLEEALNYKKEK